MNGQPTAENTRERGADGDLPGFRSWSNDAHVADLARVWNIDATQIPHYAPPTHAMQMSGGRLHPHAVGKGHQPCRLAAGAGPNPFRPFPGATFLVVQDLFLTETAQIADVVLPAATWGEKTRTFTNADRTGHLSEKAVEPPGEARPDFDIFLDYARRLILRNKNGQQPLVKWHDAESAFEAWKECSRGRPCDYTAITYAKLRERGGIQWPCNDENPEGTERLYTGGKFWSDPDYCESYGRDLITGAALEPDECRAMHPSGKAVIKAAAYLPPHEQTSKDYPFVLTTGRTLYHFHTRTKTARAPQLRAAAPEVWVECSARDAAALGLREETWPR